MHPATVIYLYCVYGCVQMYATRFSKFTEEDVQDLLVQPPWERPNGSALWVRGNIRTKDNQDLVITGPRLKVVYGGCRWYKLVFALPGASDTNMSEFQVADVNGFERFLADVSESVKTRIWNEPSKFKPGATSTQRFVMDSDYYKESSDPTIYPNELRTRLLVIKTPSTTEVDQDDHIVTELFMNDQRIHPTSIQAGMYITPIFRINYFRNIDRFGIQLTCLRGLVEEGDARPISEPEWVFDV